MLDGRLSLVTPEGVRLLLTPAGPYKRAIAWLLDFLLWGTVMLIVKLILPDGRLGSGIFLIVLFVTYWGYPIICEVYFGGRTVGKRVAGLEVVRADGLPVGWRESILRNLLLVADFMPMFYMTGLLCMIFDTRFRRAGDIVAGTLVVYREQARTRAAAVDAAPIAPPFALTADQQRTLADLFERESHLPVDRMVELGTIAEPLTGLQGMESVERMRAYVAGFSR
ncbi:RDD family protein [Massilia sp. PAMC28688]|uniref:RDD family protein n=1 Tax=Massilia sp. PAMC28688 TaxID=2861283 RepID=UPI001C629B9C|nr:RDD family protein [Massilia sp. PAMC28688]QYF93662.1 RDD family protein [Massilia sp. PAMC28688]